jgi:hypothetical protein
VITALTVNVALAYTTSKLNNVNRQVTKAAFVPFKQEQQPPQLVASKFAAAAATAALSLLLTTAEPALASSKDAAQISLNSLPPTTVSVQIQDLPVVGSLLSGTYTKVDAIEGSPSVTIVSPKDKIAAIKSILSSGHLEFDVKGLLDTHLDVDVAADSAGVATVRVASPLIPQLPFKNAASANFVADSTAKNAKPSDWSSVTNLGNGETYYYNEKTGVTQYEKPSSI